jgi:hypothetical protein
MSLFSPRIAAGFALFFVSGCMMGMRSVVAGSGQGIVMAYEVSGRVVSDEISCFSAMSDVSVALFDASGTLLDETRTDTLGKFVVGVRNPDAAEGMLARLDGDDPTVQVTLRVQTGKGDKTQTLRLPRPLHGKEYKVRVVKRDTCVEM